MRGRLGNGAHDVGKVGLFGQINTVGRDLDARQDELTIALSVKLGCLLHCRVHRQATHSAAGVGNDAVGAEVDAAVLNFQKCASVTGDRACGQLLENMPLKGLVESALALARR